MNLNFVKLMRPEGVQLIVLLIDLLGQGSKGQWVEGRGLRKSLTCTFLALFMTCTGNTVKMLGFSLFHHGE